MSEGVINGRRALEAVGSRWINSFNRVLKIESSHSPSIYMKMQEEVSSQVPTVPSTQFTVSTASMFPVSMLFEPKQPLGPPITVAPPPPLPGSALGLEVVPQVAQPQSPGGMAPKVELPVWTLVSESNANSINWPLWGKSRGMVDAKQSMNDPQTGLHVSHIDIVQGRKKAHLVISWNPRQIYNAPVTVSSMSDWIQFQIHRMSQDTMSAFKNRQKKKVTVSAVVVVDSEDNEEQQSKKKKKEEEEEEEEETTKRPEPVQKKAKKEAKKDASKQPDEAEELSSADRLAHMMSIVGYDQFKDMRKMFLETQQMLEASLKQKAALLADFTEARSRIKVLESSEAVALQQWTTTKDILLQEIKLLKETAAFVQGKVQELQGKLESQEAEIQEARQLKERLATAENNLQWTKQLLEEKRAEHAKCYADLTKSLHK